MSLGQFVAIYSHVYIVVHFVVNRYNNNSKIMPLIDFFDYIVKWRFSGHLYNACISDKGCSVVDYFLGNQHALSEINKFSVIMVNLIEKFNLCTRHPTDHSILCNLCTNHPSNHSILTI